MPGQEAAWVSHKAGATRLPPPRREIDAAPTPDDASACR